MTVLRIAADIAVEDPARARAFYGDLLGLETVMDRGWIVTLAAPPASTRPQLSAMTEGGSGAPVLDLSIEVDDLEEALARMRGAGVAIVYGPADEPWGVRRFFVRAPFGKLLNILTHAPASAGPETR